MLLESDFLEKYKVEEYQIIKQFQSKKNRVFLIRCFLADNLIKEYVLKEQPFKLKKEVDFLLKLTGKGINVPRVIYTGQNHFLMEYIPGPTLLKYVCQLEKNQMGLVETKPVFKSLASWLKEFYRTEDSSSTILGDLNFRNFILFEGKFIYGIDFEDCRKGEREEDIGRLCAFGLTYHPEFTSWKLNTYRYLFHFLVEELKLDISRTEEYFQKELTAIKERRGLPLPPEKKVTICSCRFF